MKIPWYLQRFVSSALVAVCVTEISCLPVRRRPPEYAREAKYAFETKQWQLSNGLRVTLLPDNHSQLVTMSLQFPVGAALEPANARGIAHLAEHITFLQPSGHTDQTIAQMHATHAVYSNASTSLDATEYISRFAPSELGAMVAAEALRWTPAQCQQVSEAAFIKERDVVVNEMAQRADAADLGEVMMAALWPAQHPYRRRIGGTPDQVASLTVDAVCAFLSNQISVNGASLVFSGPVSEAQIRAAMAPFGKLAASASGQKQAELNLSESPTEASKPMQSSVPIEENAVMVAWPLPTDPTLRTQTRLVARLMSSQIETRLADHNASVQLRFIGGRRGRFAAFIVSAAASHQTLFDGVSNALETRDDWISTDGFSVTRQGELTRWQQNMDDIDDKIDMAHDAVFDDKSPSVAYYMDVASINRLTASEARNLIGQMFPIETSRRLTMSPAQTNGGRPSVNLTSQVDTHDQRLISAQRPQNAESPTSAPEVHVAIIERSLSNGLRVILAPNPSASVVRMTLSFAAHAGTDSDSHQALRWLAADERLPRASVETQRMFTTGARIFASSNDDAVNFSITGLPAFADLHVDGLAQWLRYGGYYERSIDRRLQQLRSVQTPRVVGLQVSAHALLSAVYGERHPYRFGQRPYYFLRDKVSEGNLRRFAEKHFTGGNATLLVTGNFDTAKIGEWIDYSFPDVAGNFNSVPLPPASATGVDLAMPNDESGIGMTIAFACRTDSRTATSYAQQLIMAQMLSDVASRARSQLAASYGVSAAFVTAQAGGMFKVSGKLNSSRAAAAIDLIQKQVTALADGSDASKQIFTTARHRVVGDWLTSISNPWQTHQLLRDTIELRQPTSIINDLPTAAANVVYNDIVDQLSATFAPSKRVMLLAGQRADVADVYRQLDQTRSEPAKAGQRGPLPKWLTLPSSAAR